MSENATKMNPELVKLTRSGMVESVHRGSVVVVNRENEILLEVGDVNRKVFTRSAMKFIQALPLIETGAADHYGLTPEEIAVICASHNGEQEHLAVVSSILKKAGIPPEALGCGTHRPFHGPAADSLLAAGLKPTPLHNNCSGKHSGFLALAKFLGAPLENYLDPQHPVQVMVREAAADLYELSPEEMHPGVDGCSAPNYALPLINQAIGFKNLVTPRPGQLKWVEACRRVVAAVTQHPHMVAGTSRYCTDLMRETKGEVIGKVGAEGVYNMAVVKEGIGIAIKIDDGAMGPQYNVAQAVLIHLGMLSPQAEKALENYRVQEILNFMKIHTGQRYSSPEMFRG